MSRTELRDILITLVPLMVVSFAVMAAAQAGLYSKEAGIGIVVAIAAASLVLSLMIGARLTRRRRARFVEGLTPLPDDEFLRQMNAAGDYARFCIIVRNGFAGDCCVAAEMLRPDHRVRDLEKLCFDGFFLDEIVFALEQELPRHVADIRLLKCFRDWETITLGGLIDAAARELGIDRGAGEGAAVV